jgi:hypothetical protein
MTRLILTADASAAGGLKAAGRADIVIPLEPRLVWGPLPSDAEFAAMLAKRTSQEPGSHWLDYGSPTRLKQTDWNDLGLIELCQRCETVELWMETEPNAQLVLIWLLDYLHSHAKAAATNLLLCLVDAQPGEATPQELAGSRFPVVGVTRAHLEIASLAWRAYRALTPQPWFNLLNKDLSILPQLRQSVLELLDELPMGATGLGATEMRMLELISAGNARPFDVFPGDRKPNQGSPIGRSDPSWTGSRVVRHPLCPASTRGRLRWRCTTTMAVTSDTSAAN